MHAFPAMPIYVCSQHAQHPLGGNCVDVLHMFGEKNGMTLYVAIGTPLPAIIGYRVSTHFLIVETL